MTAQPPLHHRHHPYTLFGTSCHLSWYGLLEASVPIVQCLFLDLGGGRAEPRLHTFVVRGDRLPPAEVRAVHRASYAALASAVTTDADERRRGLEQRSAVLARVARRQRVNPRVGAHLHAGADSDGR